MSFPFSITFLQNYKEDNYLQAHFLLIAYFFIKNFFYSKLFNIFAPQLLLLACDLNL